MSDPGHSSHSSHSAPTPPDPSGHQPPSYEPGPAAGIDIVKEGEKWTLALVREMRHPPEKVWRAITEPEHLRAWAPFDADRSLAAPGSAMLTTVGAPTPMVARTEITKAEAPRVLEYTWGGAPIRWELQALENGGTRLKLWHSIPKGFISMGAAGWHICLDVLERALEGRPIGRIVGADALGFGGWHRLNAEYARRFGVEPPAWPPKGDA